MVEAGTVYELLPEEFIHLDDFILEFIFVSPEPLLEDRTVSMNEYWLYDNLKHILGVWVVLFYNKKAIVNFIFARLNSNKSHWFVSLLL